MLLLLGMQQMLDVRAMLLSVSFKDLFSLTLPELSPVVNSLNTWAPFLFACAYLTTCTSKLLVDPKIRSLANSVGGSVQEEAQYGQLYLRLVASLPMNAKLPEKIREAAYAQVSSVVSSSRLRSFVTFVLSLLVIMTVAVLRPVVGAIVTSVTQIVFLEQLRTWPVPWSELGSIMQAILKSLSLKLESLVAGGFSDFFHNPIRFAFHVSIFVSLMTVSFLPHMEERRKVDALDEEEEETTPLPLESAGLLSKLGVASASRLSLLSENGSVENALERWRMTAALVPKEEPEGILLSSLIRIFGYRLLGGTMILAPLAVSYFVGRSPVESSSNAGLHWDSVVDVSVILAFVFGLVCSAMDDAVSSMGHRPAIAGFLSVLSTTVEEVISSNRRLADMQFQSSITHPNAGINVRDLWAAHTTKRAWAVRGANLQCKNGEILVLLGDDGAGKTRLLTTLAESMVFPPKRSLSSNKVRGSISLSGVAVSKWDRSLLKRRVGILLSDVRTVADTANFVSGSTLEEILEPMDGLRNIDPSHKLSASERSAMILALKITGLYSTLLPKLPSKLSTIITANEEDLRPSLLRPRCNVLSPSEWSKLLLTKVLAQTVFDNDNSAGSSDKVEHSLVGSVLLLDDPTALLSEVDEAKLLKELRRTGAATIVTSNKWAAGRFGDHIAVVKDGAVVESGTHNELLARGPQQSLYAAKWHAMTVDY